MAFDPAAYLEETSGDEPKPFDPDAYLADGDVQETQFTLGLKSVG